MNQIDEGNMIFIILGCALVGSLLAALVYSVIF